MVQTATETLCAYVFFLIKTRLRGLPVRCVHHAPDCNVRVQMVRMDAVDKVRKAVTLGVEVRRVDLENIARKHDFGILPARVMMVLICAA